MKNLFVQINIKITPDLFETNGVRRRLMLILDMNLIVQHVLEYVNTTTKFYKCSPVFDTKKRIKTAGDIQSWFTSKPCQPTVKSHISHCVCDSGWEDTEAYIIEKNKSVFFVQSRFQPDLLYGSNA